jgi:hypothetical protein
MIITLLLYQNKKLNTTAPNPSLTKEGKRKKIPNEAEFPPLLRLGGAGGS